MFWTRKLGKLVGGKATPFQVAAGALFGAWIGFLPEFGHAPGLVVAVWVGLAVVNANLIVAGVVGFGAKLLSLLSLPVAFEVGRRAIDGPLEGAVRAAANAPGWSWLGLERYTTTGGMLIGTVVGLLAGVAVVAGLGWLRRGLFGLSAESEKFQAFVARKPVRAASFVFLGRSKPTLDDLSSKRVGLPVRPVGLVGVLLLGGVAYGSQAVLGSRFAAAQLQKGLERANGATVDLAGLELDLAGGRVAVERLAVADRARLDFDLFRGLAFEADLDMGELLRGRVVIDKLVVREARADAPRETAGVLVEGARPVAEAPEPEEPGVGEHRIEDLLSDAQLWRGRLERVREWVERLAPGARESAAPADETLQERLERQAQESGLREVRATHLLAQRPRWVVRELVVEGLVLEAFGGENTTLVARNFSSSAELLGAGPGLSISADDSRFDFGLEFLAGGGGNLSFGLRGIDVDTLTAGLAVRGTRPVSGGQLNLSLEGGWGAGEAGRIDLPLEVELLNTDLTVPGFGATRVDAFRLPIAVRGPIDGPAIRVDDDALVGALVAAGKQQLADRVRAEAEARLAQAQARLAEEQAKLRGRADGLLTEHLVDGLGIDPGLVADVADLLEGGDVEGAAGLVTEVAVLEAEAQRAELERQAQEQTERARAEIAAGRAAAEAEAERLRLVAEAEAEKARQAVAEEARRRAGSLLGGWGKKP